MCGSGELLQWVVVSVVLAGAASGGLAEPDEQAVAIEKIAGLGLADDSLSWQERPEGWLTQRRDRFRAELIEGLDDPRMRVAEGCLAILDGGQTAVEVREALVRIALQGDHPLCAGATLSLCRYAGREDVDGILRAAIADERRFGDARDRAKMAEALGQKEAAAMLLIPLLDTLEDGYDRLRVIERLGAIGHGSAIEPLTRIARGKNWSMAAKAYLALAEIDPHGCGLTADQKLFLTEAGQSFKADRSTHIAHWSTLAELNRTETRPYALQMLASDTPAPALLIVQLWRDAEALVPVREAMMQADSWQFWPLAAAYLDIEGTDASCEEVLSLAEARQAPFEAGYLASAVAESVMPRQRKLEVFRSIRRRFGAGQAAGIARALTRAGEDMPFLLASLMDEETDLAALGAYTEQAGRDKEKRFAAQICRALDAAAGLKSIGPEAAGPMCLILEAAGRYEIPEAAALADRLLDGSHYEVRLSAARISAALGGKRQQALEILNEALGSEELPVRRLAAECLSAVACRTDDERQQREQNVLKLLGTAREDYALRVLTTCAGTEAAEALMPVMDDQEVGRAVYAAWVLAQHPDAAARNKALRRLAIFAAFHYQVYQQGAGVDCQIAEGLYFHQVTEDLNPASRGRSTSAVNIPDELLIPFAWDEAERAFAIAAYRRTYLRADMGPGPMFPWGWAPQGPYWDSTHMGLLQVIAREDPWVRPFHVQGRRIADFPQRRHAAQIQARITGRPACFIGLEGEEIWTDAPRTEPYDDQDAKVARYLLDLIAADGPRKRPVSDVEWGRLNVFDTMLRNLCEDSHEGFGPVLKDELLAQARRQNLTGMLKQAGYELWRDQPD